MHKSHFLPIVRAVENHDDWFKLRRSASGEISASPLKKCLATVRVIACRYLADAVEDNVHTDEVPCSCSSACLWVFIIFQLH
jgi:hypothetical protein